MSNTTNNAAIAMSKAAEKQFNQELDHAQSSVFVETEGQHEKRLDAIVREVNSKLDVIQSESILVGNLLIEAKAELTDEGKSFAEFILWCKATFEISKTSVLRLMKVAAFAAEDTRFNGCALRVIHMLAKDATEAHLERAAEFLANGPLTTNIVEQLLNPKPVAPAKAEAGETDTVEQATAANAALDEALANVATSEDHTVDSSEPVETTPSEVEALRTEIGSLTELLSAANELISNMKNEKVSHNSAKNLPMLPQFKSKTAYVVLGLSVEQAEKPAAVKKALRELVKCGYGEGHEAFELLTAAKDKLLA